MTNRVEVVMQKLNNLIALENETSSDRNAAFEDLLAYLLENWSFDNNFSQEDVQTNIFSNNLDISDLAKLPVGLVPLAACRIIFRKSWTLVTPKYCPSWNKFVGVCHPLMANIATGSPSPRVVEKSPVFDSLNNRANDSY